MKRENPIAYIPSRYNYMTAGILGAKQDALCVSMVLNGVPRTKRTWCKVRYTDKGVAYIVKYGYKYYLQDMEETF